MRNLVDNAIRYSPPGVARRRRASGQEDGAPWLRVDDAGPGIPPAERERVFDRFYRRAGAGEEGSGLGLAIVRSVAERHGATLALGDSPAGGLRATLRFPRRGAGVLILASPNAHRGLTGRPYLSLDSRSFRVR